MSTRSALSLVALLAFATGPRGVAQAQAMTLEQKERALGVITNTADRLCNVVRSEGSIQSAKVNGQINAEVNGLVRSLANLGMSSGGTAEAAQYQGVRHQDLAPALRDVSECRQRVFERLVGVMLGPGGNNGHPPQRPERPPPAPAERVAVTPRALRPVAAPGRDGWTRDPRTGCHVWNFGPRPGETVGWSGGCSEGMASGFGTADWRSGGMSIQQTGTMVAGRIIGDLELLESSGFRFRGTMGNNGQVVGPGVLTLPNGWQISGQFYGSPIRLSGNAVIASAEFRYDGGVGEEWQPHGFGTLTLRSGPPVTAMWTNGCGFSNGQLVAWTRAPSECPRSR